MAKITKLPGMDIISGFKGTLDFYVHMGQPCVRSWPKSPGHDRAPLVQAQWPAFTIASKAWAYLAPEVQSAYNRMSAGLRLTGRDIFIKSYIKSPLLDS